MIKKNGFLMGLAVLGLSLFSPLTASSWEVSHTEPVGVRDRAVDGASLKAACERRKSEIREAASPALTESGPAVTDDRGRNGLGAGPVSPLPLADETDATLASEPAAKVAAALRHDPNRVYRFLATQTASQTRIKAVLDEVRDHVNRSTIPQIEKDVKSSTLRAVGLGLKARAAGETTSQSVLPAARVNSTTEGLE